MSDTPRTDADYALHGGSVCPEFARILERELAAVTAERYALKADLCTFAVDMEKQLSALAAERDALREGIDLVDKMHRKASAERDALKAKLATINHVAMSLFVRSTSSEVTGEMAEIGRLSREDGQ